MIKGKGMEDMKDTGKILVFTRMVADGFDDFMGKPDEVIATVEDMGFFYGFW